jgi:hypothetical protein
LVRSETSFALAAAPSAAAAFGFGASTSLAAVSPFAFAMESEIARGARREGRSEGATAQVAAGAGVGFSHGASAGADLSWQGGVLAVRVAPHRRERCGADVCVSPSTEFSALHAIHALNGVLLVPTAPSDRTGVQRKWERIAPDRSWVDGIMLAPGGGHHTNSAPRHHHTETHNGHINLF